MPTGFAVKIPQNVICHDFISNPGGELPFYRIVEKRSMVGHAARAKGRMRGCFSTRESIL